MTRWSALAIAALLLLTAAVAAPVAAETDTDDGGGELDAAVAAARAAYPGTEVVVTDAYTSDHSGVTHVYLRQAVDGTPVMGAEATVNVLDGAIVHAGDRFLDGGDAAASGESTVPVDEAVSLAMVETAALDGRLVESPALVYRALGDGTARLAWRVQLEMPHHWWNVYVDAEDGRILHVSDFVDSEEAAHIAASTARHEDAEGIAEVLHAADGVDLHDADGTHNTPIYPPDQAIDGSSYNVYPMPLESPLDGTRRIVDNPADAFSSPFGWHDTDGVPGPEHTTTRGNNVWAYADTAADNAPDPASEPDGGEGLDFDHLLLTYDATPATYRDAAVDNLFYWNNVMHDVSARYGFTEEAGNFQQTNYSGEGLGGDPVLAEAQDGSFVLNANFATPEDGRSGRMQMFLWVDAFRDLGGDVARVHSHQVRDGDVDAGVIAHEYGHGISNRLVGGPSNVECLRTHDERQGEGWSDWWSYALTMRPGDDGATPRGIGNYVIYYDEQGRQGPGIRITPYSTDMDVNPTTYDTIRSAAEPHGVGYVWATYLWDMYWALVDVHGFNPNPYEGWETGGNNLALQLVVDGMKMAVCEPGFTDARDAIIAADAALTGDGVEGENFCLIWEVFARRGLGVDADQGDPASKVDGIEGYAVPAGCASA
jgi:extracellular elastinolytic metalloproteinase